MTSAENELQEILNELKNVSLKMQQLVERKKVLSIMQELKNRVCYEQTEATEATEANDQELKSIDKKLHLLEAKQAELQLRHDKLINGDDIKKPKKVNFSTDELPDSRQIFFVEPPPTMPAPTVTLDYSKLQFEPCKTQCPECLAFITTKTSTSVSSVTWLACVMAAMMGCVAGCCLVPFCMNSFKSTTHKCPRCNTHINTVKKL